MRQGDTFDPVASACALPAERHPFVAFPAEDAGWFNGGGVISSDPCKTRQGLTVAQAAEELDAAYSSTDFCLAAALIPYEGPASVHVYSSAMVWENGAWRVQGTPLIEGPESMGLSGSVLREPIAEMDEQVYTDRIDDVKRSIVDGDVYVLNLTYRVNGLPGGSPGESFARLIERAPSSMQALFVAPERSIASVSPERFLSIETNAQGSRIVRIQPIKGTIPRAAGPLDRHNAQMLLDSEKERAEHVMIVDMERNDLGRVSVPGTVVVDPLFEVIPTPYCHQMVSTVESVLRPDVSIADVLEATFPCGSVTGAPKLSAMDRIAELELSARGVYTGALLVAMPGRLDSSVLIRTLEYHEGVCSWGTGGGITIDSDPGAEWAESVLKTWPIQAD